MTVGVGSELLRQGGNNPFPLALSRRLPRWCGRKDQHLCMQNYLVVLQTVCSAAQTMLFIPLPVDLQESVLLHRIVQVLTGD